MVKEAILKGERKRYLYICVRAYACSLTLRRPSRPITTTNPTASRGAGSAALSHPSVSHWQLLSSWLRGEIITHNIYKMASAPPWPLLQPTSSRRHELCAPIQPRSIVCAPIVMPALAR